MSMKARRFKKLWIGLGVMVLLAPMGLILPEFFKAGGAWGEWGIDEIKDIAGYIPEGLRKLSGIWSAPFPDYTFSGWDKGIRSYLSYIISGLLGVAVVVGAAYLITLILKRGRHE